MSSSMTCFCEQTLPWSPKRDGVVQELLANQSVARCGLGVSPSDISSLPNTVWTYIDTHLSHTYKDVHMYMKRGTVIHTGTQLCTSVQACAHILSHIQRHTHFHRDAHIYLCVHAQMHTGLGPVELNRAVRVGPGGKWIHP